MVLHFFALRLKVTAGYSMIMKKESYITSWTRYLEFSNI